MNEPPSRMISVDWNGGKVKEALLHQQQYNALTKITRKLDKLYFTVKVAQQLIIKFRQFDDKLYQFQFWVWRLIWD